MIKMIVIVLCCISTNVFATKPDSGQCPWKLPFTIKIHALGSTWHHSYNIPPHHPPIPYDTSWATLDTETFEFTIDSSHLTEGNDFLRSYFYSANDDTIMGEKYHSKNSQSIEIVFAQGTDSIISLTCGRGYNYEWGPTGYEDSTTFSISTLRFDDTSIFAGDSSLRDHHIVLQYTTLNDDWYEYPNTMFGLFTTTDFSVTSIDLSGSFRATHFSNPPSSVSVQPLQSSLTSMEFNGSLKCSFESSLESRVLEVYSVLGSRVASALISPEQSEAIISKQNPGFYFIRLGNQVAKVLVSE